MTAQVGLSTTCCIPGYEGFAQLISTVRVVCRKPVAEEIQFRNVNDKLTEKALEMGGNTVLGIVYQRDGTSLRATGTIYWLDKLSLKTLHT